MTIQVAQTASIIVAELLVTMAWYRMSKQELLFILTGVSLGLKAKGEVIPDLELAITTGEPELFLGKEMLYEQKHSERISQ